MIPAVQRVHAKISGNGRSRANLQSPRSSPANDRQRAADVPQPINLPNILQSADECTDQIRVLYRQRELQCQLNGGKNPILTGTWNWELLVEGGELDSSHEVDSASWENTCWEQNIDVSYAEMQIDLPSGLQIQRQILLAVRDRFALLADVVAIPGDVGGLFRWRFQLGDGISTVAAPQAREMTLHQRRRAIARVIPISLPEWRQQAGGELESLDGLTFSQRLFGRRLHMAAFIDLDPRRVKRQLTWRQLTVGESLQVVQRDVAVGYRIQIGKEQWLIYRSLAPTGNRTVLGQNFSTEFVVARFRPNGIAEKMLEIIQ